MQSLDATYKVLPDPLIERLMIHEERKLLIYRRGPLVFAFNFHPTESYADLRIPVPDPTDYKLILDTDEKPFEGFGRVAPGMKYIWDNAPFEGRNQSIRLYLPNRTAQVLRR